MDAMETPCITTLTGPSGTGKSFLAKFLCEQHGFMEMLSTTTRKIRPGEKHGVNYYFVSKQEFEKMLDEGQLMQHVNFLGNYYGATAHEAERVINAGKKPIIVVEPTGLPQIAEFAKQNGMRHNAVYLGNPDSILIERLLARMLSEEDPNIGTYVQRIQNTMGDEKDWVNRFDYDLGFLEMGAEVMEDAAEAINALHVGRETAYDTLPGGNKSASPRYAGMGR